VVETKTRRKVGIPKEIYPGERRVATPDTAKVLQKLGFEVLPESGAGVAANFTDDAYKQAGCDVPGTLGRGRYHAQGSCT